VTPRYGKLIGNDLKFLHGNWKGPMQQQQIIKVLTADVLCIIHYVLCTMYICLFLSLYICLSLSLSLCVCVLTSTTDPGPTKRPQSALQCKVDGIFLRLLPLVYIESRPVMALDYITASEGMLDAIVFCSCITNTSRPHLMFQWWWNCGKRC